MASDTRSLNLNPCLPLLFSMLSSFFLSCLFSFSFLFVIPYSLSPLYSFSSFLAFHFLFVPPLLLPSSSLLLSPFTLYVFYSLSSFPAFHLLVLPILLLSSPLPCHPLFFISLSLLFFHSYFPSSSRSFYLTVSIPLFPVIPYSLPLFYSSSSFLLLYSLFVLRTLLFFPVPLHG